MKLRSRTETKFCHVEKRETKGKSLEVLKREARQVGEITVDFHYLIQRDGTIEAGREINEIAGNTLPDYDTAIYIFADAKIRLTDAQKCAIYSLYDTLESEYPGILCLKL